MPRYFHIMLFPHDSSPVPPAAKYPHNIMLPPLFFPKCLQKLGSLSQSTFANCNLGVFAPFGVTASSLLFIPYQYKTCFPVDKDTLLLALVLGLIHIFCSRTRLSLGHRTRLLPE
ncbi:hypothetical protein CHARACLAT_005758 [Characodon lateralis]|uniref:Uncharacterized protein n=1 Tax=Characodon lateralis TaxID=208331 RepID=A0ABU7CVU3_9TELE|nr:hypothetical protein [Characodon lateralis]